MNSVLLRRALLLPRYKGVAALHTDKKVMKGAQSQLKECDSIQAAYLLNDQCILVDEYDNPIGHASKGDCHHVSTAALHRAFSVFLFTPDQKLILQKRSASKVTFPSVWTNSCCSHPLFVEDEMDTSNNSIGVRRAAQRKLEHEMGIQGLELDRMNVMGRFLYKASSDSEWLEHELDYALVVTNFDPALIHPNPEEVADFMLVDPQKLDSMIKTKRFSPWFALFNQFNWLNSWWQNLGDLDKLRDMDKIHRLN
ncbi:unnamed protein product [Bursaphelenchus xylophilus]|uniref:isopentenyl-diphosphate Delta-isomerase n=1 Tax=Bursaphelenchus xylophilus TaxID=6326 RepID=A0A1I7SFT2_BURXY|nr:unnamed protein product [Bursaphelenchus xylophilus]CAG9113064.1 unnamed protein product [Bursaphelenchus xylophilus]